MNREFPISLQSQSQKIIQGALNTLEVEIEQVKKLKATLQAPEFLRACELLINCQGKVICMGVGKSGHIANKIAASLSSTGTSAFFVHPCEAGHGDLGMIRPGDLVIFISNSGECVEFNQIYPYFHSNKIPVIAITNNLDSSLAQVADVTLKHQASLEACPLNLAPTATSTNTLVLGDCLVSALIVAREFTKEDFAQCHPFGALGKKLLMTNNKIMKVGNALPLVKADMLICDSLITIANKTLGCVLVVDKIPDFIDTTKIYARKDIKPSLSDNEEVVEKFLAEQVKCLGIFTDGDLRRLIASRKDIYQLKIGDAMTKNFVSTSPKELAYTTLSLLERYHIQTVPVIDEQDNLVGIIHMNDILDNGI